MSSTTFSGPVNSTAGFVGDITGDVTGDTIGDVTGDLTGLALQGGSITPITTTPAAIPITTLLSLVYPSDGSALALSLADGAAGQMKIIKFDDGTGATDAITITPANFSDGANFVLNAAGECAILVSDGSSWHSIYNDGTIG